ncbi:hypothetical protein F5Y16DRAFT_377058 [Xylariaceae sp. FL0255]|nr:hypothetical protein F5Y16DRAFT_377058 [Xylariaceae sp. FL0255]
MPRLPREENAATTSHERCYIRHFTESRTRINIPHPSMNTSDSNTERRSSRKSKKCDVKVNKACLYCRSRKIKCDASVIGIPCSSCTSRQRAERCTLPNRQSRTRKDRLALPTLAQTSRIPATSSTTPSIQLKSFDESDQVDPSSHSSETTHFPVSQHSDRQNRCQTQPDFLYLNILNETVKETVESCQRCTASNTPYPLIQGQVAVPNLSNLDDIDIEYLSKRGVFDLPSPVCRDALIKSYFDHVYPFAPVINRFEFIQQYQARNCSLFLLRTILTTASAHTPADILSTCGFTSRSAAQNSFFSKAKLLHDFSAEEDPLVMLQGCIILSTVILDHRTDWDYGYWFHNAINLATKLNLRNICVRKDKPANVLKLYRRIWWSLHFLDIFYVSSDPKRSRLLEDTSGIEPCREDDWEAEDVPRASSTLLSMLTPVQKVSPVVHYDLGQIFAECLSTVKGNRQQHPRQIMRPFDAWRQSLAQKMHVDGSTRSDVCYLNVQALSYRFECMLCRLIRSSSQQSQHANWSEWANQRLASAILELDMIAMRVLANGTLQNFPVSFTTTMTALLALHIESALDLAQTDLVRSMARISISQIMLILTQGKEIPAIKRAIPIFEEILTRKNLDTVQPDNLNRQATQPQDQEDRADTYTQSQIQGGIASSELAQGGSIASVDVDFLGLGFLDGWEFGQLDFTNQY